MNNIYFSVIIPTYKRYDLLFRAVNSILQNNAFKGEIIIIDTNPIFIENVFNGIKDLFYDKHIDLIIRSCPGFNPSEARNFGISIVKYEYISFLDDDDYVLPNKYLLLQEYINKNDGAKCWVSHSNIINYFVGNTLPIIPSQSKYLTLIQHIIFDYKFGSPSISCKKDVFEMVGYFDVSLKRKQDFELILRILLSGIKIRILDSHKLQVIDKVDRNNMPTFKRTIIGELLLWNKYFTYSIKIPIYVYLLLILESAKTIFNSIIQQNIFLILKLIALLFISIPMTFISIFISLLTKLYKLIYFKILKDNINDSKKYI